MSVCTFLAADCPLPEKMQPEDGFCLEIDTRKGTKFDGDRDDNYGLYHFQDVRGYTDLQYGVELQWFYYTPGRAKELIRYIADALRHCDRVELWTVWLMDFYEYEERPYYRTRTVSLRDLTCEDIAEVTEADVWRESKLRPVYDCLRIVK